MCVNFFFINICVLSHSRENPEKLFEVFLEIAKPENDDGKFDNNY